MSEKQLKAEQIIAIESENKELVVSASAGSGKTFVMINRIVRLITENKTDVNGILCVTFTEAAAADMKNKLKKALLKAAENGNSTAAEQYPNVATADISTLHGFCARLVRTYFFRAGVSPDFKIFDESEAAEIAENALDATFRAFYKENDKEFKELVDCYKSGKKDDALRKIISATYDLCSAFGKENVTDGYDKIYTADGKERFYGILTDIVKPVAERLTFSTEKAKKVCEKFGFSRGTELCDTYSAAIDRLINGGAEYAASIDVNEHIPSLGRLGKIDGAEEIKNSVNDVKDKLRELYLYVAKCVISAESLNSLYDNAKALKKVVERFSEFYEKEKKDAGALDFNDLEKYALIVLSDDEIRNSIRKKYKYVFVDEYQDINDVQEKIISAISDKNLFVVGDQKQSIYAFRGCKSEIFENRETAAEKSGAAIKLNYSFRSAEKVINAVNEIFDNCYTKEYTGLDYKNSARLRQGGVYPEDKKGRAQLHLLIKGKKTVEKPKPRVYDLLEEIGVKKQSEKSVSTLIANIINEELGQTYFDPDEQKEKRITMNDIAILARTGGDSAYVRGVVEGLSARNVRVVSDVKQNACDFPEIGVLINALKLIDNFKQDIPLASTLLSAIGGFTEEELSDVALYKRDTPYRSFTDSFYNYIENGEGTLKQRLIEFKKYFDGIRGLADFKGAKGILERLAADSGYENTMLSEEDGDAKLRRYYKFLSEAEKDGKSLTVKDFLNKIEKRKKAFECSEGGDEDAVKVITMHSSKGLEYPVVIVIGLEKSFNSVAERGKMLFDKDLGLFANYFDKEKRVYSSTGFREIVKAKMRNEQNKEEMRLLYVATTRAKYSLHLVMESESDPRQDGDFEYDFLKIGKFSQFIPKTMDVTVHDGEFNLSDATREKRQVIIGKKDDEFTEKMRKDISFIYPWTAEISLPIKNSVTAATRNFADGYYTVPLIDDDTTENDYAKTEDLSTDREKGIIAHKIMQFYDFNGAGFSEEIHRLIDSGVITEEEYAKIDRNRLRIAAESPALKAVRDKTLFKEKDFIVYIPADKVFKTNAKEEVLLQGIIDLLAVKDGYADIIDYKYSRRSKDKLISAYKTQLDLYAYAAEKAAGVKVKNKILVNLFTGETFNVD